MPQRVRNNASLSHLADLRWADPNPTSSDPISVILGADIYGELLLDGIRKGAPGSPTAQNSLLGWILSGPLDGSHNTSIASEQSMVVPPSVPHISVLHCGTSSLESEIRRFWEIEDLPEQVILKPEDEQCERHFASTHSRTSSGRYVVRLPFRHAAPIALGETRSRASRLLNSLLHRLQRKPEMLSEYTKFLRDYELLGHSRRAPPSELPVSPYVYLPHHPIFRASSTTTQLRVVFNASNISSNGSSLNDHLLTGPKLQPDLPAVLLKWRQYKFVYAADIARMYRQILVDENDIDHQRILWRPAVDEPVIEYQLLTVTYGTACAPFLALRVLKQLIIDEGDRYPLAVPVLSENIYVDDTLFGHDDPTSLRASRDQVIGLLHRGGFKLRKWASNSAELLSDLDEADHGVACPRDLAIADGINILGLRWNPRQDAFSLQINLSEEIPRSKRDILSAIAKLYDPLGWVTPVVIAAKIIMQHLWTTGLSWDDPIPEAIFLRWKRLYSSMSHLTVILIPRWSGFRAGTQPELVGFADASNVAYAAVVYLIVRDSADNVTVTLLIGKSKVAPLKPISVPRLELLGAALLARLLEFVRGVLPIDLPCHCMTDSTVALAWIHQHPSRWKTFVANRVADIQRRLPDGQWRHVSTTENPADCASRGVNGDELLSHALWWQGPPWLKLPLEQWPRLSSPCSVSDFLEEKSTVAHLSTQPQHWDLAERFSSWHKLLRVTAYTQRFVSRCRSGALPRGAPGPEGLVLSVDEYQRARLYWLKSIQAAVFSEEIRLLATSRCLSAKHRLLALSPYLDQDGLLRVGGRLNQAPIPIAARHPILLAAHPLVNLLIEQAHLRMLHAGLQLTLSTLRREFWILGARHLVKAIIHKCVSCVRERAAIPTQRMGELPAVRISAPSRSFLHCGVDYAGPVAIRASAGRGIKTLKAYIALFVCLATRAIHLELVADYSTPAFLNAYSRFCARRGLPQSVHSDNGTTFVGAARELSAAYHRAVRDPNFRNRTASDGVTWRFIPPASPHFGGIWEAGVRSVKHHLHRVLGNRTLTFEEFTTLLCRIEACLNSRPIAPLSDSLDEFDCLTPGHFLIGSALTDHPEQSLLDLRENRLSRWQLLRSMTEQFWKLWSCDYLNTLQQRSKWKQEQPSLRVGQLVLVRSPHLPPCKWELGRVTQCHPGPDGLVRVVTIKTAASEYKRPIGKVCALPVEC